MVEQKINFAKTFSVSILRVEVAILQRYVKAEIAVRQTETHTKVK
jgi:hypothetical protein